MSLTVAEISVRYGCRVQGDPDTVVERVATLENAAPGCISFLANPRYRRQLGETQASAVILAAADANDCPVTALINDNPYAVYARVAAELSPPLVVEPGSHSSAQIHAEATVPSSCQVGPGAVVERGALLGENVSIGPGAVVGANTSIGNDTRVLANVTLCHDVKLGERCLIHPGTVIGSDGFGIAQVSEEWIKVPQLGSVRIGNDVEVGACTSIDRGAIEDTVIENGVKLDNQIQVAHNVRIGAHTVIAACVGISGSTTIGRRCMIAGAVGFVGHLNIADDVVITGQTMVNRSIDEAGVYSSALPMDDARRWRRNSARFRQLDEIAKRLKKLEKKVGDKE
ncbi:MAG: UDP-3-O-(3-hydroxymyristoyl)glucosamine N-acyltransferase [Gammaproteobacteria bacterium]|nr:UDP-3-O-(3-hydroxymyristoyl)glucosamine N-acyltransferase [Gammaproteobacteria bacterium]